MDIQVSMYSVLRVGTHTEVLTDFLITILSFIDCDKQI